MAYKGSLLFYFIKQAHPAALDRQKSMYTSGLSSTHARTYNQSPNINPGQAFKEAQIQLLQTQIKANLQAQTQIQVQPQVQTHAQCQSQVQQPQNPTLPDYATSSGSSTPATGIPMTEVAKALSELVNQKDREDPPIFDCRESFTHSISNFEDYLAD